MRIQRITAYRVELPLHEGSYKWSGGKSVSVFDSTVVARRDRRGHHRLRRGLSAGAVLSARLRGRRPGRDRRAGAAPASARTRANSSKLNRRMDAALKGHPYVKSAIDMACWDILGKVAGPAGLHAAGRPLRRRLRLCTGPSRRSRPRRWPPSVAGYRAEGYRRFQLKVGGDPDVDIERIRAVAAQLQPGDRLIADANTGWLMHDALRVVRAVRDVDVYIEQPCLTLRGVPDRPPAHATIRSCSTRVIDSRRRAAARPRRPGDGRGEHQDQQVRRPDARRGRRATCASSLGIAMTIEDSWGGDIVTAAIAHLAHSTPPELLFTATDFNSYVTVSIAEGRRSERTAGWRHRPRRGWASNRAWASLASQLLSLSENPIT